MWPAAAIVSGAVVIVFAPGLIESDMSRWEGEAASELVIVTSKTSSNGCFNGVQMFLIEKEKKKKKKKKDF